LTEPPGAIFRERTTRWVIDAPRDEVWRAWTEPEQIAAWWGPKGMSVPPESVEMDVRPGGVFRLTMVADASGAEFPTDMHYREVEPPERLVYAWDAQRGLGSGVVTVRFVDRGEQTEIVTEFAGFATDQIFTGARVGWKGQMQKFDARFGSGTAVEEVVEEHDGKQQKGS
jgi:uncharacterized protein YndB with AHSA1/START domain